MKTQIFKVTLQFRLSTPGEKPKFSSYYLSAVTECDAARAALAEFASFPAPDVFEDDTEDATLTAIYVHAKPDAVIIN